MCNKGVFFKTLLKLKKFLSLLFKVCADGKYCRSDLGKKGQVNEVKVTEVKVGEDKENEVEDKGGAGMLSQESAKWSKTAEVTPAKSSQQKVFILDHFDYNLIYGRFSMIHSL